MMRLERMTWKAAGFRAARLTAAVPVALGVLRCGTVVALAVVVWGLVVPVPQDDSDGTVQTALRLLVLALLFLELIATQWPAHLPAAPAPRARMTAMTAPGVPEQGGQGNFMSVLEGCFADWRLTSSERAVALLAIKGFSNIEIAGLRNTAEATVKCQLNAVYRKAQVTGRSQLISTVLDEVLVILPQTVEGGDRTPA